VPECPAIEVFDVTSRRADLARRREVKFVLSRPDLDSLRRLLEGSGRRQVYNRAVSTVRSIYFDDVRLSSCQANLAGLGRRRKLRIRWYDSPLPQSEFFLEIKWRDNRVTGKHRLAVRSSPGLWTLPYRTILAELARAVPEPYCNLLFVYSEPVLLVEYRREHFVSREWPLRATLDYGIVYYEQSARRCLSMSFGQRHEGLVVVEGKVPVGREGELLAFLQPFSARVQRCSKYVHGCQMLGLIDS
jgi:hypothetical protein